jgi:hypothetical protein
VSVTWEWLESEQVTKDLVEIQEASGSIGSYGAVVLQDNRPAKVVKTLSAKGMTKTEYDTYRNRILNVGYIATFTLSDGSDVVGMIIGVTGSRVEGLDRYAIQVQIRVTS